MGDFKQFDHIYLDNRVGTMRLNAGGLAWRADEGGAKPLTFNKEEFLRMGFHRTYRGHALRIYLKNKDMCQLDGFSEQYMQHLINFIKNNYEMDVKETELGVSGWNWGDTTISESSFSFMVNGKPAFEVPLSSISNSVVSNKTEVNVELNVGNTRDEVVTEIRFYIPNESKKEADDDEHSAAEAFCNRLKPSLEGTTEVVASFADLSCVNPRGKFDMDMYESSLRLHGKTYDYYLKYDTIVSLFLVPSFDGRNDMFVIGLSKPLTQGQTKYPYLVFEFPKSLEVSEEQLEKYTKITKISDAEASDEDGVRLVAAVSQVISSLTKKNLVKFNSATGLCVKCSLKTNQGFICLLDEGILFLPKAARYIPYARVSKAYFSRIGQDVSMFDITVETKNEDIVFSQISKKGNYDEIKDLLRKKKVSVSTQNDREREVLGDEEEDDEEEEEEEDKRGRDRKRSKKARDSEEEEDDDESEEDEDFNPSDDSDVPEEFDAEYTSSEDEDEKSTEKKSKKKKKKKRSREEKDDDDDDDDDAQPKEKKKKSEHSQRETKEKKKKSSANDSPSKKLRMTKDTISDSDEE